MEGKNNQNQDLNLYNNNAKIDTNTDQPVIIEERISTVSGETAIRRYSKGKMLGKGGFAKCYEFSHIETKKISASKIIQKSTLTKNRAKQKLMSEIKIHRSLHHTNIVQFEHVFEDQENVYILLELCTNQTLNELLKRRKRLIELEVQCYVFQIIQSLKYLHSNRVIHRDLKLGNLFLNDKMEIKLGDFGLATKLEFDGEKKRLSEIAQDLQVYERRKLGKFCFRMKRAAKRICILNNGLLKIVQVRTICGTPNYIAPEILDGKIGHSYEVDIWSLGVIIYTLLIGKPPFETPDVKTTYKKIRMNSYSFPDHVPISEPAKNLIVKILHLDPARRPTLDEILVHPFLNNGGTIPKTLPLSTLACPPSASYVSQFLPKGNAPKLMTQSNKILSETSPSAMTSLSSGLKSPGGLANPNKPALSSTDKFGMGTPANPPTALSKLRLNSPTANLALDQKMFETDSVKKLPTPLALKESGTPSQPQFGGFNGFNTLQSNISPKDVNRVDSVTKDFKTMSKSPTNGFTQPNNLGQAPSSTSTVRQKHTRAEVYVKKWVDYSSKYGLGYLLSNGSCGVFFNDSTKIILDPKGTYFEYIEKKMPEKMDVVSSYTLTNFPKDLQKKVTLLQHFRSYLETDINKSNNIDYEDDQMQKQGLVYVKKWLKTKHAIMFRANNKIVQVDFTDKTEIILSSEQKLVTYLNKKGERSQYPLATAFDSTNQEMAKRLKYTKDILANMLNNNNNNNNQNIPHVQEIDVENQQSLNQPQKKNTSLKTDWRDQ